MSEHKKQEYPRPCLCGAEGCIGASKLRQPYICVHMAGLQSIREFKSEPPKTGEIVDKEQAQEQKWSSHPSPKEAEFCEWMIGFNSDPEFVQKFTTLFIDACNERVAKGGYPLHAAKADKFTFPNLSGTTTTIALEDAQRQYGEHLRKIAYMETKLAARTEDRNPWHGKLNEDCPNLSSIRFNESAWIDCKVYLPIDCGKYLARLHGFSDAHIIWRFAEHRFWSQMSNETPINVSHWMPIPPPLFEREG